MDLIQKQRAMVANHIRLENEHDRPAVPLTIVQDERAFYDFVPVGLFKGSKGVQQFYQAIATAFPDLHIEVTAEYDVPGCSIREGFVTGTNKGEYLGAPPTGFPIRIAIAAFFIFDQHSGELLGERLYMDHGAAVQQMAGKKIAATTQ